MPPSPHRTPRLCAQALSCAALCLSAAPLHAQEDINIGRFSPDAVRVRAKLTAGALSQGRKSLTPHIYIHSDELTQSWRATITQEERGTLMDLGSVTLPTWFGESYYDYTLTVLPTERAEIFYAFLEAIPSTERDAPSTAFTMQLAWLVERPKLGSSRWKYIDKAYQSDLDGGDKLLLQDTKKGHGELIRARARSTKTFCGFVSAKETDAQLEYYTPEKRIFVTSMDVPALLKDATSLRGHLPSTSFIKEDLSGYVNWVIATSDLRTPTDSTTILRPLELGDFDESTVWSEGTPREGRGEFVTATISAALPLKGFRIYPGHGADPVLWATTPRPGKVLVGLSDGTRFIAELPDNNYEALTRSGGLIVEFPSPQNTECLSIMLLDAYPATQAVAPRSKFETRRDHDEAIAQSRAVTISEVTPISVLEGLSPGARSREILARFKREEDVRRRENLIRLTQQDGKYIVEELREQLALEENPFSVYDAAMILSVLDAEDTIDLLITLLQRTPTEGNDWRAIRRAAAVHGEQVAEPLWAMLQELSSEETRRRIDLTRLLGRIAPAELLEELIPLLGRGEERERNERIRAIAHGEIAIVPALIDFVTLRLATPEGEDALKTLGVLARRHGVETLDEYTAPRIVSLTRASKKRRDTLRLIHVLEHTKPEGSEALLARELLLGNQDTHVRRAAASALSGYAQELSGDALRQALVDPSPDVRITAIQSLMARPDRARIADDIVRYVDYERWTEGIKPAIFYLATLNDPAIDAKLSEWILDRTVPKRAYLSAQAFERVRRSPKLSIITHHLFEQETSFDFRRQLVELLAWETSEAGEALLIEILTEERFNTLEAPDRREKLNRNVIMSLGTRRSLRAIPLFLKILTDNSQDIKLRRVTLRALSFFEEESLVDELTELKRDAPKELLGMYKDTINTISRRLDISGAQKSIKDLEEKERLRRETQTSTP